MSTVQVAREARQVAPPIDKGEYPLQEPPVLPEATGRGVSSMLMYLPMMVASMAMMMFYVQPGGRSMTLMFITGGIFVVALVVMGGAMVMRAGTDRKVKVRAERRDYLRYLGQARKQVRRSVDKQRTSVLFTHPDPGRLWAMVPTQRLWERRANHADFAEVRIGLGQQRLALQLKAPQTKPVADLEPLCASALRRFLRAYSLIEDMPVAVYLRGFARILLEGPMDLTRATARAIVAQLTAFHSPEDLRVAVSAGGDRLRHWDYVKWLPHAQHPEEYDAAGTKRLVSDDWNELERLLGGKEFDERGRFEPAAIPSESEPFVVLVLDGARISGSHRLGGPSYRNLIVIDVDGSLPWDGADTTLRLVLTTDAMEKVSINDSGDEERVRIGRPDTLSLIRARAVARQLAPYRLGGTASQSAESMSIAADLASLLGIRDLRTMDPDELWKARTAWDHLRIPIGRTATGQTLELDLKESAQGGMGPHGIMIGATGSGKSETIRTIVLALALTHSSEKLNLVLVDFKGGATFLGLEGLPHVSAMITNLADELHLVDRMQDALQGEMVRRQELLRRHGHTSIHEYERARANGAQLAPMQTMVVIVDEFGELLTTKPEFTDLFMMIGRLGRSLGVHLLLASQRFEEGRVHVLQTHLSYRIGLRMFSAMESRSVIGTPDAYEQPLQPGTGFLRTDTTTLLRFRSAYVSGPCPVHGRRRQRNRISDSRVVPFEAGYVIPLRRPEPEPEERAEEPTGQASETVLQVIVDRLRDAGPPAHKVWLPPLDEPTTLDRLLPALAVDPERGFGAPYGGLRAPVGLVDRPFEQRRDPLVADLSGAKGHMAVVGAPRSGKSNLIRTLIAAFALTHTPREVQFYVLDFGGGTMVSLTDLPHVGVVVQRRDAEGVSRTVAEMVSLVKYREAMFAQRGVESMEVYRRARAAGQFADDPFGDVFLVIDGWQTVRQEFEKLEPQIQELASRGLTYGVHMVVGTNRWSEIRPWLRDVLQTRFELRLGENMESEIDFRKAKDVPEIPGRGLTADKYHYLAAVPRLDGEGTDENLSDAVGHLVSTVRRHWTGHGAPKVRRLPARFGVRELPAPPAGGELRVAYALDEEALEPVWHDFDQTPHLLAFGDSGTGKTNLLRVLIQGITRHFTPDEARILLVDPKRRLQEAVPRAQLFGYAINPQAFAELLAQAMPVLQERVPGADIPPDRLSKRDWWTGSRMFVFIDDYEMMGSPMNNPAAPLIDLVAQGAEIGLHVVIARNTGQAMRSMMSDQLVRRMWDLSTPGLLFSCPRDEGNFLGDAKPLALPTGRAQAVLRRRGITQIQVALDESAEGGEEA